jgi:hypothetical protein
MKMDRVEAYRRIYAGMKESGGKPPSQKVLDQFYGCGWERDLSRVDDIDDRIKRSGNFESYLSLGRYAIEKRKADPSYRRAKNRAKNRLGILIIGAVFAIVVIFEGIRFFIPEEGMNSPLGEKIATAVALAGIGAIVGLIADFRRRHK